MSELEFRVEIDSVTGMFKVYGRLYDIDPPVTRVVEPLKFRADHEGCLMEPCMELSHGDASSLMDQLYACGIRPTEDDKDVNEVVHDEVGFLKAILRCSVCNELLVFEDKSIDPPNRVWGVSPCEVCMAKVKSSIKAFTTALKELTDE